MKAHAPCPLQAFVFDFDGTLAELVLDFQDMKERLADAARPVLGRRPTPGATPVLEWLEILCKDLPQDADGELRRIAHELIRSIEIESAEASNLFSFTKPMLEQLRKDGVATAVVTRNCRPAVLAVFPDIEDWTGSLLTRDDVVNVKPHPEHLHTALNLIKAEAPCSLMVGDHVMDVEAGKAVGMPTAGVTGGRRSLKEFRDAGADFTAHDAGKLVAELRDKGYAMDASA
jgi:phosphoglycolate phosphatase